MRPNLPSQTAQRVVPVDREFSWSLGIVISAWRWISVRRLSFSAIPLGRLVCFSDARGAFRRAQAFKTPLPGFQGAELRYRGDLRSNRDCNR